MQLTQAQILASTGFINYSDVKRLKFILDSLQENIPAGGSVLDVGCGNGIITRSLGKAGFNVKGIDISEKAIEKAKSTNNLPNVTFTVVSAEELAVSQQRYDCVICSEVLEHLNQPQDLLKVLYQSLEENGILVVTVPNGQGPREFFVTRPIITLQKKNNLLWKFVQRLKATLGYTGTTVQSDATDLTHIQFFTKKSLNALAENNLFHIKKMGKTNFVENVFPFSFLTKRSTLLQKFDCIIADLLPYSLNSGFVSVWKKK
ncbi:MAG: methyltransferase domain-containing protein [Ferruginibacter sp.]|nr:methyltransferase domain-containing protein [Ferruginibacter sp.]